MLWVLISGIRPEADLSGGGTLNPRKEVLDVPWQVGSSSEAGSGATRVARKFKAASKLGSHRTYRLGRDSRSGSRSPTEVERKLGERATRYSREARPGNWMTLPRNDLALTSEVPSLTPA